MEYVCWVATPTPLGMDVKTNRRSLIPRAEKKIFFRKATSRSVFLLEISLHRRGLPWHGLLSFQAGHGLFWLSELIIIHKCYSSSSGQD